MKVGLRKDGPALDFARLGLKMDLLGALRDCMRRGLGCAAAAANVKAWRFDGEVGLKDGARIGLACAFACAVPGAKKFVCDCLEGVGVGGCDAIFFC